MAGARTAQQNFSIKSARAAREFEMANDSDWVADVRRWVMSNAASPQGAKAAASDTDSEALGYEAADPTLQAAHWPTVASSGAISDFARLR